MKTLREKIPWASGSTHHVDNGRMLAHMTQENSKSNWWGRRGVRARSTISAVVVVLIALIVGSVGLVVLLNINLTNSLTQGVNQRALDISAGATLDDLDTALASAGSMPGDSTITQVLDENGSVVLSSPAISGEPAIIPASGITSTLSTNQILIPFIDNQTYVIASIKAQSEDDLLSVVTGQSLDSVNQVVNTVTILILAISPLLLIAVGVVTWISVGRSLQNVDKIRARVEMIGSVDLGERVPVPEAKDEIQNLAETMNHMLDRLENSMKVQRQFVADASHELRSPLASMRASIDVSQKNQVGSVNDSTQILSQEVDRMTHLVDDLLLLAKTDEGLVGINIGDVDIDDLLSQEANRLRLMGTLDVQFDGVPARMVGDSRQISRAIRNLVDNANRFAESAIKLSASKNGSQIRIRIEDDGPGIPESERVRVLERFVRLDEHRARSDGGSGLGLAIVNEIARSYHGEVLIGRSELGGAQVTLVLEDAPTATGSSR